MEYKKIGDILELQRGYDLPVNSMIKGNVPVVGSNGIVGYHNVSKSIFPTITMGRSGTIGKVHYYDRETWVHNTALYVSDFKGNNPLYLYYLLDNLNFENLKSSSVVPSLNRNYVYPMKVPFYKSISEQEKISSVLWRIDKKIALNTRINSELEAMAKQLYDYWFVQFDFPDENGNPYKSSGGKMVYNPILKCEIPAGWDDCELKDLTEVINGATPLTTKIENYGDDIIWITPNDLSNQKNKFISCGERSISQKGYDSCSTSLMPAGSVLMSSRAPIGLMAIAEVELCTNQGFKSFVPFDMSDNYFLYYYIQEHMPQIEQLGAGTTFREVSRDTMLKFPILKINDRDLYIKWYEQVDAIGKEQINLLHQIRNLTHLRDSLLPMLMNGQVTVE